MSWPALFIYFVTSTVVLTAAGEAYALVLRFAASRFARLKVPLGILLYLAFAATFFISLAGLQWLERQGNGFWEFGRNIGIVACLFSMLIAVTIFFRRHQSGLRELGYFQSKR